MQFRVSENRSPRDRDDGEFFQALPVEEEEEGRKNLPMTAPISSPVLVLAFALAASSFLLLRRGQGRDTSWILEYLRRPLRLRGIVGLKEIGTRHKLVPDVVLCLLLGLPGVVLFGLGHRTSLSPPFRTFVLAESVATAAVSAYADGLLHEEYLWVDQKTSVVHVLTWAGVLWRSGPSSRPARRPPCPPVRRFAWPFSTGACTRLTWFGTGRPPGGAPGCGT